MDKLKMLADSIRAEIKARVFSEYNQIAAIKFSGFNYSRPGTHINNLKRIKRHMDNIEKLKILSDKWKDNIPADYKSILDKYLSTGYFPDGYF